MSERSKAMCCKRRLALTVGAIVAVLVATLVVVWLLHRDRMARSPGGPEGSGVDDARTESSSAVDGVASHVYEASASFRVGTRKRLMTVRLPEYCGCPEILNRFVEDWRKPSLVQKALREYKARCGVKAEWRTCSDEEIVEILSNARFATRSSLDQVSVSVSADDPELATQLAKAYMSAIATHMEEENLNRVKQHLEMCRDQEEFLRKERDRLTDELSKYPEGYLEEGRKRLMQELKIVDGLRQGISNSISDIECNDRKNWLMISPGEVAEARIVE